MNEQVWWYLARASGLVAWALLVASVVWGVLLATRVLKPADRPAWLAVMHRWLGGLAVWFTALHLVALVADNYVHFGWADLLVPGASSWRTGAVAVGVVSFWLLLGVQTTSLALRRMPRPWWKGVHYTSYAAVWGVSVHAGLAGTDVTNRAYQALALLLTTVAVAAAVVRVLTPITARRRRPSTSGASAST